MPPALLGSRKSREEGEAARNGVVGRGPAQKPSFVCVSWGNCILRANGSLARSFPSSVSTTLQIEWLYVLDEYHFLYLFRPPSQWATKQTTVAVVEQKLKVMLLQCNAALRFKAFSLSARSVGRPQIQRVETRDRVVV